MKLTPEEKEDMLEMAIEEIVEATEANIRSNACGRYKGNTVTIEGIVQILKKYHVNDDLSRGDALTIIKGKGIKIIANTGFGCSGRLM